MKLDSIIYILVGSTAGVVLRTYIKNNFKKTIGFYISNISLINILAAFFLGILVALNLSFDNLSLLFYVGFLGCFSTFSSFIYQLFRLLQEKKYLLLLIHYFELFILSFLFFFIGYYIISII